jgi:putative transposase
VSTSRYHTGVPMHYTFHWPKGAAALPGATELSREARLRLRILDYARAHSVSATCRHFGIARSTYYRWAHRFDPHHLPSLETRSSRPHRCQRPHWTSTQVIQVRTLREQYPGMGKDKLAILLHRRGETLSVSMVGRILRSLWATQQLHEARSPSSRTHARHRRPYAIRKPKDYAVETPGALVQVDTMELRPLPGMIRRHFSAVDCVSRYSAAAVRTVATAGTARDFLDYLIGQMPFSVKAIQVDGGSEFMAEFEIACRERDIRLFTLPPRSPKLNGCVERLNRTYRQEFYEHYDGDLDLPILGAALAQFEQAYNTQRPHQALGYQTPAEALASRQLSPTS